MPASSPPDHGPDGSRPSGSWAPESDAGGSLIDQVERLERELADLKGQERAALNEALRLREQLRRLSSARLVRLEQRLQRLMRSLWRRLRRDGLFSRRLAEERQNRSAALNVAVSLVLGVSAAALGRLIGVHL